jgi:hypothetical protein
MICYIQRFYLNSRFAEVEGLSLSVSTAGHLDEEMSGWYNDDRKG